MGDADTPGKDADSLFGYEAVTPGEKTARVRQVFDSVADRYDVMNDLMSAGLHRLWKRFAMTLLDVRRGHAVLDVAAGSADLTRLAAERGASVVWSTDINTRMLARGRDRNLDQGCAGNVQYVLADAEALPFPAASMDRTVIGFGLRNVTAKDRALAEMARVLKPAGRAVILEFSQCRAPLLSSLYDAYSFKVLPRLGRLVAGDADSYRYLAESIRVHPDQDALSYMMKRAGFDEVRCHDLCGGIVAAHVGWVS